MSGDTGRQSSSEVAHEAEDTRAHLASTLEQLRNNLRPENVMEEVVSNARIGAASVADNIAGVAKQYPIPAMLIAAGSALVMRVFAKGSETTTVMGPGAPDRGRIRRGTSASDAPMPLRVSGFKPAPGRGTPSPDGSTAVEVRDGIVDSLSARGATLKRQAQAVYDSTSSQAGDAMQNLSRYLPHDRGEVKSKLSTLLDEQPLILGAIGLAIGAAIGAALPMTETEDNLMGGTSHRFRDSATDAARHEIDGLRAVASDAVGNVRQSAGENLHGFANDVGANARVVIDKAGDTFAPGSRDV